MRLWTTKGEELEAAKKDFIEIFKTLEGQLGDKPYFGGENFGFVDVTLLAFYGWFYVYETIGKFSLDAECPKIIQWTKRCLLREPIAKIIPDQQKLYEAAMEYRKKIGME